MIEQLQEQRSVPSAETSAMPVSGDDEFYHRLAQFYRVRYGPEYARMLHRYHFERMMAAVSPSHNQSVLDAGCGGGAILHELAGAFGRVVGLDLSLEMLSIIERNGDTNRALVRGDMTQLPLPDASIDVVVTRGALSHAVAMPQIVGEMHRVLKPGGTLVVSEPSLDSLLLRIPRAIVTHHSRAFRASHKAYARADFLRVFGDLGMAIVREEHFGYLAFPLCDLSDLLPVLPKLPARNQIAALLIQLDRFLAHVPLLNRQAWHIIITARKA